jgi:hypothetical protein
MEHQNEQSSTQSWALSDNLREVLDTRVTSFLESLDTTRTSTSYSKAMNAWGVTPRRDSILSESGESSAAAEERAKAADQEASTEEHPTEDHLAFAAADHPLNAQIMLAESVTPKTAEKAEAEQEDKPKVGPVLHQALFHCNGFLTGLQVHSCTIDGACLRDLWLRGMVTVAGTALLLCF